MNGFQNCQKLTFTVKGLYETDSMFESGIILVFHRISFLKNTQPNTTQCYLSS